MKNWGSDVIPKEKWINTKKIYKTRNGKRVCNLKIVMENGLGNEVTFPVKGGIVIKENPLKMKNEIWTLCGKNSVLPDSACYNSPSQFDLIEVDNNI